MKAFSQYLLRDDQPRKGPRLQRYSGFETGLRTSQGQEEAGLQRRSCCRWRSSGTARSDVLWGRVRPATGPTRGHDPAQDRQGQWKRLTALDDRGVYGFSAAHRASQRYRAKWTRPDGGTITGPPIRAY